MEYRELGGTNKKVSVIGLGAEHLDGKPYSQVKETIDAALESGITVMDVFMPGKEVRENIAKALGARRSQIMIQGHIGSTDVKQQYDISRDLPTVKRYFEDLLRIFGGYIDFGMMFFIDSDKDYKNVFETGFADYVLSLKEKGHIGHVGFSSHNPITAMRVIRTGLPETMMFSINPAFDMLPPDKYVLDQLEHGFEPDAMHGIDPERAELYKLCTQKQIGITVMKTLGGGKLISSQHTPFAEPLTVAQCIHYALSRPAVSSVLLGMQSQAQVAESLQYFGLDDSQRDYTEVLRTMRNDFKGNCVYCSHCQPCPAAIDIAAVNKYLDIARLDSAHVPPSVRSHYLSLQQHGGDCIRCGNCEVRCPFDVKIMAHMAEAQNVFGK